MKKGEEVQNKIRNNRFVEAFGYLRRNHGDITRIELAKKMGVSKDTITRIMHAYTPFTDDAIIKFHASTGCIFNLQWLRGESDIMLAPDESKSASVAQNPHQSASMPMPDYGSLMNATIAAQDSTIASLKRELADKDESIRHELSIMQASAKRELAAKEETISALRGQLATKDAQLKDKDAYIESLKQQVADLRYALAKIQAKEITGHYPYPMGLAEERQQLSK